MNEGDGLSFPGVTHKPEWRTLKVVDIYPFDSGSLDHSKKGLATCPSSLVGHDLSPPRPNLGLGR